MHFFVFLALNISVDIMLMHQNKILLVLFEVNKMLFYLPLAETPDLARVLFSKPYTRYYECIVFSICLCYPRGFLDFTKKNQAIWSRRLASYNEHIYRNEELYYIDL